jgi:L-iditol 2-dehydrogenase
MPSMQAILFYGPGDARLVKTPIPTPGPGELLVKVGAALTCGTDLKSYRRGHPRIFTSLPSPFGHEFAGVVVEVGAGVERFAVEQRVVAANSAPCGECVFCREGHESLCERLEFLNGAYAEYIVVPERIVRRNTYLIPDHLTFAETALVEPLACVLRGLDALDLQLGDTAVVLGCGPIGLLFVNALTLRGLEVIASDRHESRLAAARRFGAVATVNAADMGDALDEQIAAVRALTPEERGAPIVIEAVGRAETWEAATRMARRGAQILLFGGAQAGTTFPIDGTALHYDELTIKGVFHHTPRHIRLALHLIASGALNARDYLTSNRPLAETIAALEGNLEDNGERRGIKTVILPPGAEPAPLGALADKGDKDG